MLPLFQAGNRRELLTIGGLSLLGLSSSQLARLRAQSPAARPAQAKSCIFLFLFGGPSQVDLWDMKPSAAPEIRGEFQPIATRVPGIQICEHLPLLAEQMDKVCLLRSMTHRMNVHGPACSEIFTGREYFGPPTTDQATSEDWPSLSSLAMRFGRGERGLPPSVVLPWYLQFPGQARRIAGQTGARMGEIHNALLVSGDVGKADFQFTGLALAPDLPWSRMQSRHELRTALDFAQRERSSLGAARMMLDENRQRAWSLLENRAGDVLDLSREPAAVRERFGPTTVGQSLLLARRLVEAGVPLVTVNWQDETHIDGVNTCWDTHQNNFAKLKDLLCPIFDRAYSALVSDLAERGLLETTLVVAVGEFGRTPRMGQFSQSANTQATGRDHWPHAFTALLAGGGVSGGQVYGATNENGGYVVEKPVSPANLTATILDHLSIDPSQTYHDEFQKLDRPLSVGHVVRGLGAIARAGSEIRAQPSQAGCHELSMIAAADSIDSISAGLCLPNTRGMASYCDRSTRAPSTPRVFRRASIPQPPRVAAAIFATNVVRTTTYAKSRKSEQFFAAASIFRHRGKSKSGNDLRRAPRGFDSPPQSTTAWCRVGIPTCPPLAGAFPPVSPV